MQFFSPPLSVYKTSYKSLPTSFSLMGLQLLYHATRSSTTSSLSLDNLFLPSPVVWILPSLLLPRQSFPPWTKLGLPAVLLLHGPYLCSWSRRKTEVGNCVATLPTSLHVSLVLLFFLSWINRRGIIKFQSRWRTSRRLPSSTPSEC